MFRPAKDVLKERWEAARNANPKYFDKLMSLLKGTDDPSACWEYTQSKTRDGYGQIRVNGPKQRAHRLMFEWFYPGVPFVVVRHSCNNPSCCNPAHLRGGTQKDNAADRKASGREGNHKGTKNGRAKLTPEQVLEIRQSEECNKELSIRFGVSSTVIGNIKRRVLWKHI